MAANEKHNEQIKQLTAHGAELEGKEVNGNKAVANLSKMLGNANERTDNAAYEENGLQPRLQQLKRGQDRVDQSISRVQDTIDRSSTSLIEDWEYMELSPDKEGREMAN